MPELTNPNRVVTKDILKKHTDREKRTFFTKAEAENKVDKETGKALVETSKVTAYDAHLNNSSNPHSVTKAQLGLGNVDNKSESTIKSDFTGEIAENNQGFVKGADVFNLEQILREFINSTVSTATATYRGKFNVVSDLGLTTSATEQQISLALPSKFASLNVEPDNNDYVTISFPGDNDSTYFTKFDRYKFNGSSWILEFTLNNSSYTAEQWDAITSGINAIKVAAYDAHVASTSNPHSVTKAQVGLGNVDNTSDADKPISTATQTALNGKVDKSDSSYVLYGTEANAAQTTYTVDYINNDEYIFGNVPKRDSNGNIKVPLTPGADDSAASKKYVVDNFVAKVSGKGLSTNDYDDTEKTKLASVEQGAQANIIETVKVNGSALPVSEKEVNVVVPTQASDVSALPDSTKYAASFDMTLDSNTYQLTIQLKDQDGNAIGASKVIDFPIESLVVNGSYNSNTKKIILTLKNNETIEFSVADLVAGLQREINSSHKLDADLVDDSSSTHKFTSASEKEAWNAKVPATRKVNGHTLDVDVSVTKSDIGLGNVDNKSSATIKSEFTGSIASGNSGFVTGGTVYTALADKVNKDTTTGTFVYAHNGATEIQLAYKVDAVVFSVVQRDVNGNVKVALTPVDDNDAISKKYIEDCFTEIDIEED